MKRYGWLMLIAAAGCSPQYQSGKTQCSDKRECPSGYSCSDDGTSAVHYCFDNNKLVDNQGRPCPSTTAFYCSQSQTCWAKPGACVTVTYCGTTKHPGSVMCANAGYHPDCNGDSCLPNGAVPDAGPSKGGTGGSAIVGVGGATGTVVARVTGGSIAVAGVVGYGGLPGTGGAVAGKGGSLGTGGAVTGKGGSLGTGGSYGTGGSLRTGGSYGSGGSATSRGSGGLYGSGGATGRGGTMGSGGSTAGSTLCSGTPITCSVRTSQSECQYGTGCTWSTSTSTCTGTASGCTAYASSTLCIVNGCDWSGGLACNATPSVPPCTDMTPSTACETCFYNSCCGQLTNCVADSACYSNQTGPSWNAYMDCATNCCRDSCF